MTEENRKPSIRIDGAKRRDLNKDRVGARMAGVTKGALSPDQITARKKAAAERGLKGAKLARTLRKIDGGKEGAKETKVKLRISGQRTTTQTVRARPGTFEWRYGRDKQSALFHAGSQFARLWERAGIAVASSADFLRGTASGFATGIPDGRVAAVDEIRLSVVTLGQDPTRRLIAYCVEGKTCAEVASVEGVPEREMCTVLASDLRACARVLRFGS